MDNPWLSLPNTASFLLASDLPIILHFNTKAKSQYKIHGELLPEPYLGDPQANILLLNLNPGFDERDIVFHQCNDYFVKTSRANLAHANQAYPFYLLDPYNAASPGAIWWGSKLKRLIDRYGVQKIANEVCVIEYFPYHSEKFGYKTDIPSQIYGFSLLQEAMKRNALVIQMRSRRLWQSKVPGLSSYPHYYKLNNPRNTVISENNCPDGYPAILKILG